MGVVDHLPVLQEKDGRKGPGSLPTSNTNVSSQVSDPLRPVPMATYGSNLVLASFDRLVLDPRA